MSERGGGSVWRNRRKRGRERTGEKGKEHVYNEKLVYMYSGCSLLDCTQHSDRELGNTKAVWCIPYMEEYQYVRTESYMKEGAGGFLKALRALTPSRLQLRWAVLGASTSPRLPPMNVTWRGRTIVQCDRTVNH